MSSASCIQEVAVAPVAPQRLAEALTDGRHAAFLESIGRMRRRLEGRTAHRSAWIAPPTSGAGDARQAPAIAW